MSITDFLTFLCVEDGSLVDTTIGSPVPEAPFVDLSSTPSHPSSGSLMIDLGTLLRRTASSLHGMTRSKMDIGHGRVWSGTMQGRGVEEGRG